MGRDTRRATTAPHHFTRLSGQTYFTTVTAETDRCLEWRILTDCEKSPLENDEEFAQYHTVQNAVLPQIMIVVEHFVFVRLVEGVEASSVTSVEALRDVGCLRRPSRPRAEVSAHSTH